MPETVTTGRRSEAMLQVNPFVSNRYHFGMLLGEDDLETEQAYHRGKMWLHSAWLHGTGVVWGLFVEVRAERGQVVVHPGLAIDAHGRELVVAAEMCVDLVRWYEDRRPDDLKVEESDDGLSFDLQVELCHDSCLDRPVPAISEPCEGARLDTAYSRTVERGWPRLVVPRPEPMEQYPRLRQLFSQEPVTDATVLEALAAVGAAALTDLAATCLTWFRRVAAADVTALNPQDDAPSWSPFAGDGCVLLADLHVVLARTDNGFVVEGGESGTVADVLVRPSHVRTRTTQELLGCGAAEGGGAEGRLRAVAGSAALDDTALTLTFTRSLAAPTVQVDAFTVTALADDGWTAVDVSEAHLDDEGVTVTLTLAAAPTTLPVRVVARGTGPAPLLAADGTPLCGVAGDPVVPSGSDAALTITEKP